MSNRRNERYVCLLALMLLFVCAYGAFGLKAFYPEAGSKTSSDGDTVIDYSHKNQGYLRVKHKKIKKNLMLRISKDGTILTYELNHDGKYEIFPLQLGDGEYKVTLYRQVTGNRYTDIFSRKYTVQLEHELLPYLCPNQYVQYDEESLAVRKAAELCSGLSDEEKVKTVMEYVTRNIKYDFFTAMTVKKGYLPVVDTTFTTGKGICFDYAALTCAMLRSQDIPSQLVIGYADKTYHAWVQVWENNQWVRYDPTFASTGAKAATYTTERWY